MSYDSKCHDLAVVFISDNEAPGPVRDKAAADLAQQIQDLIEGFMEFDLVELRDEAAQAARDNSQFGAGA